MKLTQEIIDKIVELRRQNLTIKEISNQLGYCEVTIRKYLIQTVAGSRNLSFYKHKPSKEEEKQIIDLYVDKKRGIQYISDNLNIDWYFVKKVLIDNKIPFWGRSELIKSNMDFYGRPNNFTFKGRSHTKQSREKTSVSLKRIFKEKNRLDI